MIPITTTAYKRDEKDAEGNVTKVDRRERGEEPLSITFQLPVEPTIESLAEFLGDEKKVIDLAVGKLTITAQGYARTKLEAGEDPDAVIEEMENEWRPATKQAGKPTADRSVDFLLRHPDKIDPEQREELKKLIAAMG